MENLTKEYIEEQDLQTCEALLKKVLKDPNLYKPLIEHPELLKDCELTVNTICYLEDQIDYLYKLHNLEKANNARWGRVVEEPQLPPPDDMDD